MEIKNGSSGKTVQYVSGMAVEVIGRYWVAVGDAKISKGKRHASSLERERYYLLFSTSYYEACVIEYSVNLRILERRYRELGTCWMRLYRKLGTRWMQPRLAQPSTRMSCAAANELS